MRAIATAIAIGVMSCAPTSLGPRVGNPDAGARDGRTDATGILDANPIISIPDAGSPAGDALACFQRTLMSPRLVCFASDPTPYQMYLLPRDGGPAVGTCPTPDDFDRSLSEGDSGFFPCGGPLTPEQIAMARDAGAPEIDAGPVACCYWVEERVGF